MSKEGFIHEQEVKGASLKSEDHDSAFSDFTEINAVLKFIVCFRYIHI